MTLLQIIHHPIAARLGWVLLHSVWQGALIGVLFAILRYGLRRRSANARYLAGCLALALLLIMPLATLFVDFLSSPALRGDHATMAAVSFIDRPTFLDVNRNGDASPGSADIGL